nr:PREDICTED: SLIT-ROBO Rho GTPase-activating protein 2B [Anolis carolinensis]|eukprot:XP_008113862.1 PREDICTED: SLIT-ROBO Rho GTPase-activating protein 2B [Anolis carolinensis]
MTSPAKFKKDKEIIAEYDTQVKEIRAQLIEQLKCLDQQCELRVQLLQDLQDFFRKKAEIEMDYSRNLEKLAERFLAKTRSTKDQQFKKDQNVLSPVNCWNLLLNQVKRESRDHTTLSDIYLNNIIPRFVQVSEDSGRLFKKVTFGITFSHIICSTHLGLLGDVYFCQPSSVCQLLTKRPKCVEQII